MRLGGDLMPSRVTNWLLMDVEPMASRETAQAIFCFSVLDRKCVPLLTCVLLGKPPGPSTALGLWGMVNFA